MTLDFGKKVLPASRKSVFKIKDYHVWGGTMLSHEGLYYLLFSRWPKSTTFDGWVVCSEIGYAVSDSPYGPFEYRGVIFKGSGGDNWDADCIHNPTAIEYEGKYYLYYMGNSGNGEYWDHRNNQRIGVAVANHPAGPWCRCSVPVIDVSLESHDHLMTSNPSVAVTPQGKIIAVYKAVGSGALPKGGAVVCGVAFADNPLGPFTKHPKPIMVNPENDWSVEDPYIWYEEDRYYALVKDFQGYFTKKDKNTVALFESYNGINWEPSKNSYAFGRKITWEDGVEEQMCKLERPQLLLENGKPVVLICAGMKNNEPYDTFNVQIPLSSE